MALEIGDITAASGMSKDIYQNMLEHMSDAFPGGKPSEEVKTGWKKLAYCIADGVIRHIVDHMEVNGDTDTGGEDNHTHSASLSAL